MDIVTLKWKGKQVDHHIWLGEADLHSVHGICRATFLWPTACGVPPDEKGGDAYKDIIFSGPLTLSDMQREVSAHGGVVAEVEKCGEYGYSGCWGCLACASELPVGWPF